MAHTIRLVNKAIINVFTNYALDKVLILYIMEYNITSIQKHLDPRQDDDIM